MAEQVELSASWVRAGNQWALRIQPANSMDEVAINPNSRALTDKSFIQVVDPTSGQRIDFEINSSSSGQRLRFIELVLPGTSNPRNLKVTINGLTLEDATGRRLSYNNTTNAFAARVQPIFGGGRTAAGPTPATQRSLRRGTDPAGGAVPPSVTPQPRMLPRMAPPQPTPGSSERVYEGSYPAGGDAPRSTPSERRYTMAEASPPPAGSERPTEQPGAAAGDDIPQFPFPPPLASARETLPRELLVGDSEIATLKDAEKALVVAFRECGYGEESYYAVPEGFAMAASIERINADGTPNANRWELEMEPMQGFSLRGYMNALFRARPGHYRVIVFIVTSVPFNQTGAEVNFDQARAWLKEGTNALPKKIGRLEYTSDHVCTALVYEFKRLADAKPEFVRPSPIIGRTHLQKTGFFAALAEQR